MKATLSTWLYDDRATRRHLKVAAVAMACDREPAVNRARLVSSVEAIVAGHPGVDLILFGEMILGWYKPGQQPAYDRRVTEAVPGETTRLMADLARAHGVFLAFGLSEASGERMYNTQVLLNPEGDIQAIHRKVNLKPAERAAGYTPGGVRVTVTEIEGVRTGLVICADAASPRTMVELIRQRLDLLLLSLADDRDEGRFAAGINARLYDAWVVTANRYGVEDGAVWNGHLVISDPLGRLRDVSRDCEAVLVRDLGFGSGRSRLADRVRRLIVKAGLPVHVLRHWRQVGDYF